MKNQFFLQRTASLFALLLFTSIAVYAGPKTWTGADLTNPTKWDEPGNWSGGVPQSNDDAIFSNVTVDIANIIPSMMPKKIKVEVGADVDIPFALTVQEIDIKGTSTVSFGGAVVLMGGMEKLKVDAGSLVTFEGDVSGTKIEIKGTGTEVTLKGNVAITGELKIKEGAIGTFKGTVTAQKLKSDDAIGGTFNFNDAVTVEKLEIKDAGDKMTINCTGAVVTVTGISDKTSGDLTMNGPLRFQSATTYNGTLTNNSSFCSEADFTVAGALVNDGEICYQSDLTVTGTLTNNDAIDVSGTFDCSGGACAGNAVGTTTCNCAAFLPVVLTSFTAHSYKEYVELRWVTEMELNNEGFEIERALAESADKPLEWTKVGFVASEGNSTTTKRYQFVDNSILLGTVYYRLKQMDYDGQFEYSEIVSVNIVGDKEEGVPPGFYPNPTDGQVTLSYISNTEERASLYVYDLSGRTVLQRDLSVQGGSNTFTIELDNLSAGSYFVQLLTGTNVWQKQLVIH